MPPSKHPIGTFSDMIRTNRDITSPRKEIGARLAQFRSNQGLLQSEFAKELGLSPRSYQNYELGIRDVPVATIAKMIERYKISGQWLISGIGGPYYNEPATTAREALKDIVQAADAEQSEPDLSKLPDVLAIIIKNLEEDRVLNPDEVQRLVRLASKSATNEE